MKPLRDYTDEEIQQEIDRRKPRLCWKCNRYRAIRSNYTGGGARDHCIGCNERCENCKCN